MSIGIHCDKIKGSTITESLEQTFLELKHANCAQIFTHGPRSKNRIHYDPIELRAICDVRNIYVHQTYCTSWKPEGLAHMQEQFTTADELGAQGVVLHLGKLSPAEHIAVLQQIHTDAMIILEMRALKPGQYSYQAAAEINELCEALATAGFGADRAIICLDTAHLSAGLIKLTTADQAKLYIAELKYPDYIGLLHLNGNTYDPTVRAGDHHCIPLATEDHVFRNIDLPSSGCAELMRWFIARDRDVILEQDYNAELREFHAALFQEI